ncbi:MAG: hypothetical protein HZB59_10480 [Ignavibacteriales bacterium]|nr:hypothetical protein [Ignavibacteriales bacterium]
MKKKIDTKCGDVFTYICDKLDQNIDSPKCRIIKKHLDECPKCTAYLDSLKRTILLYRAYPPAKVPSGSSRKILAKLKI